MLCKARMKVLLLVQLKLILLGSWIGAALAVSFRTSTQAPASSACAVRSGAAACSPLFSYRQRGDIDDDSSPPPQQQRPYAPPEIAIDQKTDRPTETAVAIIGAPSLPAKPKIVVLGATGGVGRNVVRQLMSTDVDMTVVAFCRSYDKALETLYGDGAVDDDDDNAALHRKNRRGPKLEIVVGDLVDRSRVFNYKEEDEEDDIEVEFNSTTLASVRSFYGSAVADEVFKASVKSNDNDIDVHAALEEAIKDCTAIISCVGTVRPTNPWTDYVLNPVRIFRRPSRWCSDPRHPYYVNYRSTKEALDLAEKEQKRREVEIEEFERAEEEMAKEAANMGRSYIPVDGRSHKKKGKVERIKFVRISDLAVAIHPWKVVSLFTNIGRSLIFRYQEQCEMLLEDSDLVDTFAIRPGDLIDAERDTNSTSLQLDASGELPYPAYVSKEDVAAVAVAVALTRKDGANAAKEERKGKYIPLAERNQDKEKATSYTWALRWAGSHLQQGEKSSGLPNAQACVDRMLKLERKRSARRKRTEESRSSLSSRLSMSLQKRRLKPYGLAVAVPVYMVMAVILLSAIQNVPGKAIILKYIVKRLAAFG